MRRLLIAIGMFGAAMMAASCGGGGGQQGVAPDPFVRYINASPDTTALNFFLDDEKVASQLVYIGTSQVAGTTPNFASTAPVERDIRTQEDGQTDELTNDLFGFQRDKSYLVVTIGLENFLTEFLKRIRILVIEVNRTVPNANKARLIFIHGYMRDPGLETPDIDMFIDPNNPPGNNAQQKITGNQFSTARTVEIDADGVTPYFFEIRKSGTEAYLLPPNPQPNGPNTISFTPQPGKIYAAIFSGIESSVTTPPRLDFIPIQTK